jgi:hypothetical protein
MTDPFAKLQALVEEPFPGTQTLKQSASEDKLFAWPGDIQLEKEPPEELACLFL